MGSNIVIDNNTYNSFLNWNMFFSKGLKKISQEYVFFNLVNAIQNNDNKLNLYIHWFFCKSECIYCPYLKQLGKLDNNKLIENVKKIEKDLKDFLDFLNRIGINSKSIKIDTISYGGGTPSYIPYEYLESITKLLIENFDFSPKEFTIEINPTIEDYNNIKSLKKYGLNRISIGIQTFDKDITIKTGRGLKNKDVENVIKQAYNDFGNVNIDMIYGLPEQTQEILEKDLNKIIELSDYISHISYYPLYIFPGTRLYNNFKAFENKLPFYDPNLKWINLETKQTNIGGYNYNKIIDWWKIINRKINTKFDFYTMDYLVNKKEVNKKHLYQIEYLQYNPLLSLGYGYGGTFNTFMNDHQYYIYKTGKDVLLKDILLGVRLFDLSILEKNLGIENIESVLGMNIKDIFNIINNKEFVYQYYLQSLFMSRINK